NNTTHASQRRPLYRRAASSLKRKVIQMVVGDEYRLLDVARFRSRGEVHQWMYDRFSLSQLLESCGFKNPVVRTAFESAIPGWSAFKLDEEGGIVRKPDSLFMEAVK